MKLLLLVCTFIIAVSCANPRAIVQDCKNAGDGIYNCELIKKL
jgi:hypothetical protein